MYVLDYFFVNIINEVYHTDVPRLESKEKTMQLVFGIRKSSLLIDREKK